MLVPKEDANHGMILVMGCTGSGKSYFIDKLAEGSVVIGHSLHAGKRFNQAAAPHDAYHGL